MSKRGPRESGDMYNDLNSSLSHKRSRGESEPSAELEPKRHHRDTSSDGVSNDTIPSITLGIAAQMDLEHPVKSESIVQSSNRATTSAPLENTHGQMIDLLVQFRDQVAKQASAQYRRDSTKAFYDQKVADFQKSERHHINYPSTLQGQTQNRARALRAFEAAQKELDDRNMDSNGTIATLALQLLSSRKEIPAHANHDIQMRCDALQQKYDFLEAKYEAQSLKLDERSALGIKPQDHSPRYDQEDSSLAEKVASLEKKFRDYREEFGKVKNESLIQLKPRIEHWETRTHEYWDDFGKLKSQYLNDARNNAKVMGSQQSEIAKLRSEISRVSTQISDLSKTISYIKDAPLGPVLKERDSYINDISLLKIKLDKLTTQSNEIIHLRSDLDVLAKEYGEFSEPLPHKLDLFDSLKLEVFGDGNKRRPIWDHVKHLEENEVKIRNGVAKLNNDIWGVNGDGGSLDTRICAIECLPASTISPLAIPNTSLSSMRDEINGLRDGQEAADNLTGELIEGITNRTSALEKAILEFEKDITPRIEFVSVTIDALKHTTQELEMSYNRLVAADAERTRDETTGSENAVSTLQIKELGSNLVLLRHDVFNQLERVNMVVRSLDHRYNNLSTEPMCRKILGQLENLYPNLRETNTQLRDFAIVQQDLARRIVDLEGKFNGMKNSSLSVPASEQTEALSMDIKSINESSSVLSNELQTLQKDFQAVQEVLDLTRSSLLMSLPEIRGEVEHLKERVKTQEALLKTKSPIIDNDTRNPSESSEGKAVARVNGSKTRHQKKESESDFAHASSDDDDTDDYHPAADAND